MFLRVHLSKDVTRRPSIRPPPLAAHIRRGCQKTLTQQLSYYANISDLEYSVLSFSRHLRVQRSKLQPPVSRIVGLWQPPAVSRLSQETLTSCGHGNRDPPGLITMLMSMMYVYNSMSLVEHQSWEGIGHEEPQ